MFFSRKSQWIGAASAVAVLAGAYVWFDRAPAQRNGQISATEIKLWRHATVEDDFSANVEAIRRFNDSQSKWRIVFEALPSDSYTETVTAAALAGKLPCVLELDQPTVPNFAWAGHIQPIEDYITDLDLDEYLSGAIGRYKNEIYSLGQFDVSLVLFARKSILDRYEVRFPTRSNPWSKTELDALLAKIKDSGDFDYPFDIKVNEAGNEWWSYAFAPWLQSFGGDQINRNDYHSAEEALNGAAGVKFGAWFQQLFDQGYVDRTPSGSQAFLLGQAALDYSGSWSVDTYYEKWGDDLLVFPVPDFGTGPKVGSGSWQWGMSSTCKNPEGAADFIKFLMSAEEIAEISNKAGLIPVSEKAASLTMDFKEGGRWRKLYLYAKDFALVRPVTPAYPIISNSFANALRDIKDGGDVQENLDIAVDNIDRNIRDNRDYK